MTDKIDGLETPKQEEVREADKAINQIEVEYLNLIQKYFGDSYNVEKNSLERAHENIKTIRNCLKACLGKGE